MNSARISSSTISDHTAKLVAVLLSNNFVQVRGDEADPSRINVRSFPKEKTKKMYRMRFIPFRRKQKTVFLINWAC